jgi:hypothetical protein
MMRTAGRRVAANGVDYAFEEFTEYYGKDAQRIWNASQLIHPDCDETSGGEHPAESSQPEDCPTSDATGSASEQPPAAAEPSGQELALAPAVHVLLSPAESKDLRIAEASGPQRAHGLHTLARLALQKITEYGPNSNIDPNLDAWFPWRSYVACHRFADEVVGSGIVRAVAEFMEGTTDSNRSDQARLDLVFYRTDGTHCRLHPGKKKIKMLSQSFSVLQQWILAKGPPQLEMT